MYHTNLQDFTQTSSDFATMMGEQNGMGVFTGGIAFGQTVAGLINTGSLEFTNLFLFYGGEVSLTS